MASFMRSSRRLVLAPRTLTFAPLLLVASCASPKQAGWRDDDRGDTAGALEHWTPLTEHGDADAQFLMALIHDEGTGVLADPALAARWHQRAAGQGHAAAHTNLGLLHYEGRGVSPSFAEAATWFGRPDAQR